MLGEFPKAYAKAKPKSSERLPPSSSFLREMGGSSWHNGGMRIGVFVSETWGDPSDLAEVRARARQAEELGFASGWIPYLPWSLDALVALQGAGEATSRLELGTSVIPSYLFHPLALARQANSVSEVLGERLSLGIGCSQQVVIEQMHGVAFERPARHIREYVEILRLAARSSGHVGYKGEIFQVDAVFGTPSRKPYPILVGALGPLMLQVAGEFADGTIATWCDPVAIERVIVPGVRAAAEAAQRPAPRVGAVVAVTVTDARDAAVEKAREQFAVYDGLPRYKRMVDLGEGERAADVCVIGDETEVRRRLHRYADAGLTDLLAAPFAVGEDLDASRRRTLECLADLVRDF